MSYPSAYSNIPSPGNPRETEAWALTEAARRMAEGMRGGDDEALLEAVRLNFRLWTLLQAEIANPDSEMPADVRANMLSLCQFIDKTTVEFLGAPQPEKANILITINRHIAAGLFTVPPDQAADATALLPENLRLLTSA